MFGFSKIAMLCSWLWYGNLKQKDTFKGRTMTWWKSVIKLIKLCKIHKSKTTPTPDPTSKVFIQFHLHKLDIAYGQQKVPELYWKARNQLWYCLVIIHGLLWTFSTQHSDVRIHLKANTCEEHHLSNHVNVTIAWHQLISYSWFESTVFSWRQRLNCETNDYHFRIRTSMWIIPLIILINFSLPS